MACHVENMRKDGYCLHLPDGLVFCEYQYRCDHCVVADRIRKNTGRVVCEIPLFGYRDARPQTPAPKGEVWFRKPVILSVEAMERLGLEKVLKNQIIIAEDGPGVFKQNVTGEIDAILYADLRVHVMVSRHECYGLPTRRACEVYDGYYSRSGLKRLVDFFEWPPEKPKRDSPTKRRYVN